VQRSGSPVLRLAEIQRLLGGEDRVTYPIIPAREDNWAVVFIGEVSSSLRHSTFNWSLQKFQAVDTPREFEPSGVVGAGAVAGPRR